MTNPSWSTLKHKLHPGHGLTNATGLTALGGMVNAGGTHEHWTKQPLRQADGQGTAPEHWPAPPRETVVELHRRVGGQPAPGAVAGRPLEPAILESLPAELRDLLALLTGPSTPLASASGTQTVGGLLGGLSLTGNEAALLVLAARRDLPPWRLDTFPGAYDGLMGKLLEDRLRGIVAFCDPDRGAGLDDAAVLKMLRSLSDSGAAGWAIIEKVVKLGARTDAAGAPGSSSAAQDRETRARAWREQCRVVLQAARVLDPGGERSLSDIQAEARRIVETGEPDHPKRLAAHAMHALDLHGGVRTAAQLQVPDRTAVAAVRNGLGDAGQGSDHAFANARLSKAALWSKRATNPQPGGLVTRLSRAFHKNPLGETTLSEGKAVLGKLNPALVSMRATLESAHRLSAIFDRLKAVPDLDGPRRAGAPDDELAKFVDEAAYHHAVFAHWAERPVVSQQIMRALSPEQKAGIKASILAANGPDDTARASLCARVEALDVLQPETLQKTGWGLVGALRKTIDRVEVDRDIAALDQEMERLTHDRGQTDRIESLKRVREELEERRAAIGTATETDKALIGNLIPMRNEDPGQTDGMESAKRVLEGLEESLLDVRSEQRAGVEDHVEQRRARVARSARAATASDARPLEQLADLVGKFEVGSSITLSNGRAVGVTVPLSIVNVAIAGSGGLAGELRARTGKDAVFSAGLSATGGEISFGTMRRNLGRAKVGGLGGIGGDHWKCGIGGTAGYTFEGSGTNAVVLRIPRTGKAIGTGHGQGKPGIEGDRIVASRMAEILRRLDGLIQQEGGTERMVEKLLAEFPDIQITTVRDDWRRPSEKTHKVSAEFGVGVGYVATDPPVAPEEDRRHGFSIFSGVYAVEGHHRRTLRKENGTFRVEQHGSRTGVTGTGSVQVLGALPGSQSHLASAQLQTHHRFAGRIAKLAMEDGEPNANSALLEQAPSPASPHGQVLLKKRIWELAAYKLLQNLQTLKTLVEQSVPGQSPEDRIAQLLKDKAHELTRAIEAWPDTPDSTFLMFSKITDEARAEIGQLDALARIAGQDPALGKVAAEAEKVRRRAILADGSYAASFAMRPAEHTRERSVGTPVLVAEKNRGARTVGFAHVI